MAANQGYNINVITTIDIDEVQGVNTKEHLARANEIMQKRKRSLNAI